MTNTKTSNYDQAALEALLDDPLFKMAPDLLRACKETLIFLDDLWMYESLDGHREELGSVAEKLRRAIAIAEGKK